jgi:hypothetical protein
VSQPRRTPPPDPVPPDPQWRPVLAESLKAMLLAARLTPPERNPRRVEVEADAPAD